MSLVAPKPDGISPNFARALVTFQQYAQSIRGDLGETVRNCHRVLERLLEIGQQAVEAESGEHPGRLGRLRDLKYGVDRIPYQVFQFRDQDVSSIGGASVGKVLAQYDRFLSVLHFMEEKVKQGGLGPLQGSFNTMLFLLNQACQAMENAILCAPIRRTAVLGEVPDPNYIEVQGREPNETYPSGTICKVLQQGFAWEDKELTEAAVLIAE